jgi:hypothetical protein
MRHFENFSKNAAARKSGFNLKYLLVVAAAFLCFQSVSAQAQAIDKHRLNPQQLEELRAQRRAALALKHKWDIIQEIQRETIESVVIEDGNVTILFKTRTQTEEVFGHQVPTTYKHKPITMPLADFEDLKKVFKEPKPDEAEDPGR